MLFATWENPARSIPTPGSVQALRAAIAADPLLDRAELHIDVVHGVICIGGTVSTSEAEARVMAIAQAVTSIRIVSRLLHILPDGVAEIGLVDR